MVAKTLFSRLQQQQLSSWLLLLVGVLFGRSTVVFKLTKQQHDDGASTSIVVELLVLPLYMLLVLIYIGLRAFQLWKISIQPCMQVKSMKPVSHRSPLPVPQRSPKNDQNVVDDIDKDNDHTSAVATADDDSMNKIAPEAVDQPINLTGVYKLISNTNYEEFLAAQGVSWALRRAANQARPIHRITHIGNTLTIQIQGIIESQTTYIINGPPVETNVRGRLFLDQAKYIDNGIQVFKTAVEEDYDVTVTRELSEDGQQIILTGCAIFRDENSPTVQAIQVFQRLE
jgi:hypothetical protein